MSLSLSSKSKPLRTITLSTSNRRCGWAATTYRNCEEKTIAFTTDDGFFHNKKVEPSQINDLITALTNVYHWEEGVTNIQFSEHEIAFANPQGVLIAKV
jgi:hypothetical protein